MTEHHSLEAFRRNQLIEATLDCVIENGIERTTLRSVAQRAGVTTGMVVHYFSSKAELMAAALDAAIEKVRAYLDDATGSTLGLKRIEAIATLLLSDDPADKLPGRFFIRFWLAALDHEDLKPRSLASHQNTRNLLARSIAAGKEAGTVRPSLDDRQAAELVLALILGLATEIAIDRSLMTPDRATELIRVLLQSFGGSAGPPPQISSEGTVEAMLQPLKEDQSLEPAAREELAGAIRHLYRLAQHWR